MKISESIDQCEQISPILWLIISCTNPPWLGLEPRKKICQYFKYAQQKRFHQPVELTEAL